MKKFLVALALAGAYAVPALAQDQSQPQSQPAMKTFGDWHVQCNGPAQTPCQMIQAVGDKSGRELMATSVAYLPAQDMHFMQIALPLGVSLPKGVVLKTDAFTTPNIPYSRCEQTGVCVVLLPLRKNDLDAIEHAGPNGTVTFALDGGKDINVRISFKGFADADNYMLAQVKSKGGKAPASSPSVINGAQ